jgi:hypothetical protein
VKEQNANQQNAADPPVNGADKQEVFSVSICNFKRSADFDRYALMIKEK